MKELHIDLETYSDKDIRKVGAWAYIDSPAFEILLFGYAYGDEAPTSVDLACGERIPAQVLEDICDGDVLKLAHNAAFEYGCLSKMMGRLLDPAQWRCTMFKSLYAGYPASLAAAGDAMGLPEDKRKMSVGKALIRYFCTPCKPTKANGYRTRNLPHHDPEKWVLFKEYNVGDIVSEREIDDRLSDVPIPAWLQREWETDLSINARGCAVDMDLVNGALALGSAERDALIGAAVAISGLSNPNSLAQLSKWMENETGEAVTDMTKATVAKMLAQAGNSPTVTRMLEIRQALGKTSTKKYDAIKAAVCSDGRVRGLLQFYGANRTGRWAGRLVQVQNLPRTYTDPLELARSLVREHRGQALELIYGSVQDTLSQLIRTALVASPGKTLVDADFSAIEARVISWLAGEEWRLEVFRTHGKIYEASASQMFGVPLERIKKGAPEYALRQKGKVAELALGYGGGSHALIAMGALDMGIPEEDLSDIVSRWRASNSRIVALWHDVDLAAFKVISGGGAKYVRNLRIATEYHAASGHRCLTVALPSGRKLYYIDPMIGSNRWGNPSITYMGVNDKNKWVRIETYGGKLVENIVQGIARDCLAVAIELVEAAGFPVVFHIHDEVVIEVERERADLARVVEQMRAPISWARDLPLNAEGWVGDFFKKD